MSGNPVIVGVDLDVEAALVSECVRRYERFQARGLSASDFWSHKHQAIVEAAGSAFTAGSPVTVETVALALQRAGKAALCDGVRGLAELVSAPTSVPDGDRLRELAALRATSEAAGQAQKLAAAGDLAGALAALADVDRHGMRRAKTLSAVALGTLALETVQDDQARAARRAYLGRERMHQALGGLPAGNVLILAADTNVGKSSEVLEMLIGRAERGETSGLVSMEDSADVTGARLLGAVSGVSGREIQRDEYSRGKQWALSRLSDGIRTLKRLDKHILFEDCIGGTDLDVAGAMGRMAAMGARLIVVDYIGEVAPSKPEQDRRNEIRVIAKRLKAHARRLGVALVIVSQITLEKQGDANRAPTKHALRESRDLSNSAEVIVVLWRQQESDWADVNVTIVKCKWGGVGESWCVRRSKDSGRLEEVARRDV